MTNSSTQYLITYDHIEQLNKIGIALSAEKNLPKLQEMILQSALKTTHADAGTLYLAGKDRQLHFNIMITQSCGIHKGGTTSDPVQLPPIPLYNDNNEENLHTVAAYAALSGKSINIADINQHSPLNFKDTELYDQQLDYRSRSFLAIPLHNHEHELIAVLQLINCLDPNTGEIIPFSLQNQHLAESLASQASIALTNNMLVNELNELLEKYIGLYREVTQNKQYQQTIYHQATHDELTGLTNRAFFQDALQNLLSQAKRNQRRFALIMLDLDGFKLINDSLGHDAGDIVLKQVAQRLKSSLRKTDIVSRLGGDEFVMLLEVTRNNPDYLSQLCEKLIHVVAQPIKTGEQHSHVTASMGVAFYPDNAQQADKLLKQADQAMYEAKHQGKNQVCYFQHEMQQAVSLRRQLLVDLREAIHQQQFCLYYQPIICLSDNKLVKVEALLRWLHPEKGLLKPEAFMQVAEESGIINQIGEWVLTQVSEDLSFWTQQHQHLQVSVNISSIQLHDITDRFLSTLNALKTSHMSGHVMLEFAETMLLERSDRVNLHLLLLRDTKVEVAIDNFGTGYSSLLHLQQMGVDYLKIDRSFINKLQQQSDGYELCEAMIAMAHKLKIEVIAEGIETEQQYLLLKAMGCDYGQGYYVSRPLQLQQFNNLLASSHLFAMT